MIVYYIMSSSNSYQSVEENNSFEKNNLEIDEFGDTEEISYPHEIKYLRYKL